MISARRYRVGTKILKDLTEIFYNDQVMLAGGAVRDHILKKPIRDLDFFINSSVDSDTLKPIIDKWGGGKWVDRVEVARASGNPHQYAHMASGPEQQRIVPYSCLGITHKGVEVDFISNMENKSPEDLFDIDLCMVSLAFDEQDKLVLNRTDSFDAAVEAKKFKVVRKGGTWRAHMEKLKEKFPEYEVDGGYTPGVWGLGTDYTRQDIRDARPQGLRMENVQARMRQETEVHRARQQAELNIMQAEAMRNILSTRPGSVHMVDEL